MSFARPPTRQARDREGGAAHIDGTLQLRRDAGERSEVPVFATQLRGNVLN
jgi:hypothetical protein